MGEEKGPEFYTGNNYIRPNWYKKFKYLYTEMVDMLPDEIGKVIDLGCGTGYLGAELLEYYSDLEYLGIDFSPSMIEHCKRFAPSLDFMVGDLKDPEIHKLYKPEYTYMCMETLEHIEDDRVIIESLPPGALFYFSVPNYDSAAHVRCFRTIEEVFERYCSLLFLINTKTVPLNDGGGKNKIYMIKALKGKH